MLHLRKYPFLCFFVPLILGVICGDALFSPAGGDCLPLSFVAIGVSFILLPIVYFIDRYSLRWMFGACLLFFLFFLGAGITLLHLDETAYPFPERTMAYRAVIIQKPEKKEKSMLCRVDLLEMADSVSTVALDAKALLYLPPKDGSDSLKGGDEILFYARLSLPAEGNNPCEFDYGRYLLRKGISATGYVPEGAWRVVGSHPEHTLQTLALGCRDRVVGLYRKLGFSGDGLSVLSALTIGYKEELGEEIRESFSVSGASHVLALSGLHIGILFAMLAFMVRVIPGATMSVRLLRAVLVIVPLWAFAFIAGLAPSIVRATVMCTLFVLSQLGDWKAISLNTLCVAGVGMLLYNPGYLFDVGFQLSFCAVAAILLIEPLLSRLWKVQNRFLRYFRGIIVVSIAAQLGTAPLVFFYFSRFSTHFLLTNILVLPLVTAILCLAIGMLCFAFVPAVQQVFARVLDFALQLLTGSVRWVEQLPFSSVDNIGLSSPEVVLAYLCLLLLVGIATFRRYTFVTAFLASLLCLLGVRAFFVLSDSPQTSIVFYNVRNCPAVHCISGSGDSWLVYADSVPTHKRLLQVASPYWRHLRLSAPHQVAADYEENSFMRRDNFVWFAGKRICMLNDDSWRQMSGKDAYPLDYLYICKGYTGDIQSLAGLFPVKTIVLDSSLPAYRREALREECRKLNLDCINLLDGASVVHC